jgi:hypothetical protein
LQISSVFKTEVRQPRTEAELTREKLGHEENKEEPGFFDKIRETFSPHTRKQLNLSITSK